MRGADGRLQSFLLRATLDEGDPPAGCILFVHDSKLDLFEVFIVDDEWLEDDKLLGVVKRSHRG